MPDFPETNQSLIARVKDLGDGAAWAEFLGIYQPVVYRMARRRGWMMAMMLPVLAMVVLDLRHQIHHHRWGIGRRRHEVLLS